MVKLGKKGIDMNIRKTVWHEVKDKDQCSIGDIVSNDLHIRFKGGNMEITKSGKISKGQLIRAVVGLLLNMDEVIKD